MISSAGADIFASCTFKVCLSAVVHPDKTTTLQFSKSLQLMKSFLIVCSSIKYNFSNFIGAKMKAGQNKKEEEVVLAQLLTSSGYDFFFRLDTNRFLFIVVFSPHGVMSVAGWLCFFSRDVGNEGYILPNTLSPFVYR